MNSSMYLCLKMDYLKAHGQRVNAFGQWVSLHRSIRVINPPNLTLRELEPKCIPLLFLGWLPETRRSAIGQFFPLSWVTLQEVFAKVNSIDQVFFSFVKCFEQLLRLEAFRKREGVSSWIRWIAGNIPNYTERNVSHQWELKWNKVTNWQAISQFLFVASGACATHNDRAFTTNVYVHTEINRWLFFLKENCTGMTCQTLLIVTPSSLCF